MRESVRTGSADGQGIDKEGLKRGAKESISVSSTLWSTGSRGSSIILLYNMLDLVPLERNNKTPEIVS